MTSYTSHRDAGQITPGDTLATLIAGITLIALGIALAAWAATYINPTAGQVGLVGGAAVALGGVILIGAGVNDIRRGIQ